VFYRKVNLNKYFEIAKIKWNSYFCGLVLGKQWAIGIFWRKEKEQKTDWPKLLKGL
jgi:hypothetical protein